MTGGRVVADSRYGGTAMGEDIDSLFITGGLALIETMTVEQPDQKALDDFIASQQITPTYAIGFLR